MQILLSFLKNYKPLWIVLLVTFFSHSFVALIPPLQGDEAYFWEWSRHLSFGYYSHPPLTGWLIALITAIFDVSKYTVRLTSILLHLVTLFYVYLLALETTNSKKIANVSILVLALMPLSLVFGTAITTDSSLITFYTISVYYTRKAIILNDKNSWYLAAVFCGGMLLSKFMAILFFPGVFLFLLVNSKYRQILFTKEPYISMTLALILFSPFIYWNAQNEWLTVQFNFFVRQKDQFIAWKKPFVYVLGQMAIAVPIFWVLLVNIIIRNFKYFSNQIQAINKKENHQAASLLFLSYIVGFPLIFFLLISIKVRIGAHWAAIVYPSSCVLIASWFYLVKGEIQPFMIKVKTFITSIIMASIILVFGIWLLIHPKSIVPDKYIYTPGPGQKQPIVSHYYGWQEIGHHITKLEREWGGKTEGFFFTSKDYSLASTLSFYSPTHPQFYLMNFPRDGIHGKDFLIWEKNKKKIGANTIYITDTRNSYHNRLLGFFEKLQELPPFVVYDNEGRILRIFYLTLGLNYLGGEPDNLSIF
jgi:4-amino-4-deoxy-L-arabinose transferase-like glycosyltransferase